MKHIWNMYIFVAYIYNMFAHVCLTFVLCVGARRDAWLDSWFYALRSVIRARSLVSSRRLSVMDPVVVKPPNNRQPCDLRPAYVTPFTITAGSWDTEAGCNAGGAQMAPPALQPKTPPSRWFTSSGVIGIEALLSTEQIFDPSNTRRCQLEPNAQTLENAEPLSQPIKFIFVW